MILALTLAMTLFQGIGGQSKEPFSIDLYVLSVNSKPIETLDWFEKSDVIDSVHQMVKDSVQSRPEGKRSFLILERTGTSGTLKESPMAVQVNVRNSKFKFLASNSYMVRGKMVTQYHDRRLITNSCGMSFRPNPIKASYQYQSWSSIVLGDNWNPTLGVEDLNSYRTTMSHPDPRNRREPGTQLLISGSPVSESIALLDRVDKDFAGICLCSWGIADHAHPNVVAFPPSGIVAHYLLTKTGQKLGIALIEYLGRQDAR